MRIGVEAWDLPRRVSWKTEVTRLLKPAVCGLTFEFTRTAEAGVVSPVGDDATAGTRRAYNACRSGSGVQRGVRPQLRRQLWLFATRVHRARLKISEPSDVLTNSGQSNSLAPYIKILLVFDRPKSGLTGGRIV